jgi:hypothetical protein
MTMNNYPPGVTGNEYQIAGPSREWEVKMDVECLNDECEKFDVLQEVDVEGEHYGGTDYFRWSCPVCAHEHEFEREPEGPDPDAAYDEWRESMMD